MSPWFLLILILIYAGGKSNLYKTVWVPGEELQFCEYFNSLAGYTWKEMLGFKTGSKWSILQPRESYFNQVNIYHFKGTLKSFGKGRF